MNDYQKSINWLCRTIFVQGISLKWLIILLSACIQLFFQIYGPSNGISFYLRLETQPKQLLGSPRLTQTQNRGKQEGRVNQIELQNFGSTSLLGAESRLQTCRTQGSQDKFSYCIEIVISTQTEQTCTARSMHALDYITWVPPWLSLSSIQLMGQTIDLKE